MVGLIQKLLLDLVEQVGGADAVQAVRNAAEVPEERRFRLDTVYPDDEFQRMLQAACKVLGKTQEEVEVAYADFFGRDSLRRWPIWFETSSGARHFLERQQTIHNTFATGVRDPDARRGIRDKFHIEKLDHELVTHYRSPNNLCGLYVALARWILDYYKEDATIEESRCTKRGDAECEFHIRWPQPRSAA